VSSWPVWLVEKHQSIHAYILVSNKRIGEDDPLDARIKAIGKKASQSRLKCQTILTNHFSTCGLDVGRNFELLRDRRWPDLGLDFELLIWHQTLA